MKNECPDWQPQLMHPHFLYMRPLHATDFEGLFQVASDPGIWEQHPNKYRYRQQEFTTYFNGALASGGALLAMAADGQTILGCSRFYDYDALQSEVKIGYTFFARSCWGKGYNPAAKKLMIEHAFKWVNKIIFHVGAVNKRSQVAVERLGALCVAQQEIAYYGEQPQVNKVYELTLENYEAAKPKSAV
jgi:N-acetyltransferase